MRSQNKFSYFAQQKPDKNKMCECGHRYRAPKIVFTISRPELNTDKRESW